MEEQKELEHIVEADLDQKIQAKIEERQEEIERKRKEKKNREREREKEREEIENRKREERNKLINKLNLLDESFYSSKLNNFSS